MTVDAKFRKALRRLLPMRPDRSRVTMVLGMHRSGTSFLAGSLQQAGLELGKHSAWNPHNARGNRENEDIVALHDTILQRCGFSWDKPPKVAVAWTEQERTQARRIIDSYQGVSHWGFKDPRSLLLIEGWQALLPKVGFVGVFRHPTAVARSLKARGRIPIRYGFGLWLIYNTRLLQLHEHRPFPILNFDDPPELLLEKLDHVAVSRNLRARPAERFYRDELRHHGAEDVALPEQVAMTLQALRRIAL
jgi:hypothetical protein